MKPQSYKAAIYRDIGQVEVVELAYPECGDDDIIIRNLMCGLCGTDIAAYRHGPDGNQSWKDLEFGHEAVSEVVEIGRNVKGLQPGDHVFPNYGKALRDMSRMATVGGFSEFIRVPQCEVGYSVLPLDKEIPLETAVLAEPFVIGLRGAVALDPGPDKTAIVFGAGIIGMATAIMLKWLGCPKVMIVDISDFRLEHAKHYDLIPCNPARENLKTRACEEFGSRQTYFGERCGANLYVDAIGSKVAIDHFSDLACQKATLGIVGVHHQPVSLDLAQICFNNWHITGCGDLSMEEAWPRVEAVMTSGKYDFSSLVSHQFPVEKIADALVMGNNASEAMKVCINFGQPRFRLAAVSKTI